MKHEKHKPIQEGVMHGPHQVETSDPDETANKQRAAVREALRMGNIRAWQAKALREAINGYPEEARAVERTTRDQSIDALYNTVTDVFKRVKPEVTISHTLDMLTETVELPDVDGKKLRIWRDRPRYIDEPTKMAKEAPLRKNDEEGRNIYHTPVTIETLDADGYMKHEYSIEESGNSGLGTYVNGRMYDMRSREGEEDFLPSMHDIKALTAQIDNVATSS